VRTLFFIMILVALTVSSAVADRGLLSAGCFVGTAFSHGGDPLEGFQYTEFRPGILLGGNLLYRLPAGHSIEVGAVNFRITMWELGEKIGSLKMTPVVLSYSYQWRPQFTSPDNDSPGGQSAGSDAAGLTWHVDLGAGITLTDFEKGLALTEIEEMYDFNVLIETENALVLGVGGGAGFLLSKNLSATVDVQVSFCDVGTTWEVEQEDVTSPIENIKTFAASTTQLGVCFRFWY
jgi:hypothetical protein